MGPSMIKLLVLLIGVTMSCGVAAGVTISLAPVHSDAIEARGD